jgi:hypothetical protein
VLLFGRGGVGGGGGAARAPRGWVEREITRAKIDVVAIYC